MLVSVTRLRLRSALYLLPFVFHTTRSRRQAETHSGCLGVAVRKTRGLAFWTLSAWDSEDSLRSFLAGGPHRQAMPKLFHWCDEAATAHWHTDSSTLPDWDSAARQLQQSGRLSRVKHPSAAQRQGVIEAV